MNNIEELKELLEKVLPYVEGAYECAFPDADENLEVATKVKEAITKLSNNSQIMRLRITKICDHKKMVNSGMGYVHCPDCGFTEV